MRNVEKTTHSKKLDTAMLWTLIVLAWPTVVEQFLSTIVQYVDTAMVGHVGANATAAVGLTTTYNWLVNGAMCSAGVGILAYIARAEGERDFDKMERAASQAVIAVFVLGAILGVITVGIAPFIPGWMGAEQQIRGDGSWYFAIVSLPMIFRSASLIFGAVLRAVKDTKTPLKINFLVNVLNMILNFFLIYDSRESSLLGYSVKFYGFGLGVVGAAVASAISMTIGGILMTYHFFQNQKLHPKQVSKQNQVSKSNQVLKQKQVSKHRRGRLRIRYDAPIMKGCMKIAVPVAMTRVVSGLGYVVFTGIVSGLGTIIFAAHSIAITAETIFYIPGYGIQSATSTLVGNALGENDRHKYRNICIWSVGMIAVIMCGTGVLLYVNAENMMSLFTTNGQVIELGTKVLRLVAFTEPVFGASAVMEGIYEGLGRTKYPFQIELITMWGIRILGSLICVQIFQGGLLEVWYCMIACNVAKFLFFAGGLLLRPQGRQMNEKQMRERESR